ncbi:HpcH/HpaI aldolase/citrate lyase family protein [Lutibacter sp. B2]|nr:HpcH/HpaI aldolase/citrate lyase family protein [Lutibacter sp. B2]
MRYFDYLTENERQSIFYSPPEEFSREDEKEKITYALGATLYMPALKETIAQDILQKKHKGLISMVICLEDAIGDEQVSRAEESLYKHLNDLALAIEEGRFEDKKLPFIFIRVRNPNQMMHIASEIDVNLKLLTGFVLPKFSNENGDKYFEILRQLNEKTDHTLYAMPILETKELIYKECRDKELDFIEQIIDRHNDLVLNIRVGATDFSSIFGLRKGYEMTIYDVAVIRDCFVDILNRFIRMDKNYIVSGPVWEYFGIDGLMKEALLDQVNGFTGKTVIHPSHIIPVQAICSVSHEQYLDALSIIENNNGQVGVMKSKHENKMNEIKPHLNWAKKILIKSRIYGVYHEGKNFADLL